MIDDIQTAIIQHRLDRQIAVFSPNYEAYLKMEDDLKVLENAIASSNDILQINDLKQQHGTLDASLIEYLTEWSNSLKTNFCT